MWRRRVKWEIERMLCNGEMVSSQTVSGGCGNGGRIYNKLWKVLVSGGVQSVTKGKMVKW